MNGNNFKNKPASAVSMNKYWYLKVEFYKIKNYIFIII
jgi:hypothetical protein